MKLVSGSWLSCITVLHTNSLVYLSTKPSMSKLSSVHNLMPNSITLIVSTLEMKCGFLVDKKGGCFEILPGQMTQSSSCETLKSTGQF